MINTAMSLFDKNERIIGPENSPPEYDAFLRVYLAGVQILQPFENGQCKILDNRHLFDQAPYIRFRYECRSSALGFFNEGSNAHIP